MTTLEKQVAALFVDQSRQQWIVRDPEGHFLASFFGRRVVGAVSTVLPERGNGVGTGVRALQRRTRTTILKADAS